MRERERVPDIYTYIHMYPHMYLCMCAYVIYCLRVSVLYVEMYMHAPLYVHLHMCGSSMRIYIYIYMCIVECCYICTYIYTHTLHAHVHVHLHGNVAVYMSSAFQAGWAHVAAALAGRAPPQSAQVLRRAAWFDREFFCSWRR